MGGCVGGAGGGILEARGDRLLAKKVETMPSEYMTSWPAMPNYPAQLANIHANLVVRGIPCHTAQDSVVVPLADGQTITITRDDEYRACLSWRCGLADMTMRCTDVKVVDEVVWLYSCDTSNGGK